MKKALATILALVMALSVTTMAWADDVAKIGVTGYATLADAIAAAQADETIVLLADAAINSNTQITKNVAIDLNGNTVTVTTVGSQNAFEVQNGATFTIKDSGTGGKLDLGKFGITLVNSKLKIEGGEIKVSPAHPGAGIAVAAVGDSEVTMTGGKVVATNTACFNAGYGGTQTFNISGGTLESKGTSTALMGISNFNGHTEMTISGDTQVVMKDAAGNAGNLVSDAKDSDVIKVVGGTSDSDITAYTEETAPVVLTGDGTYHIGTTAANAAVRNAASGETVTVVKGNAALTDVPVGVTVANNGAGTVTVNGSGAITEGNPYTVPARYYYYNSTTTTTDTKTTDTKGSPKTFDAGVGIYAVTAVLSVTGMAWTAKKRGN